MAYTRAAHRILKSGLQAFSQTGTRALAVQEARAEKGLLAPSMQGIASASVTTAKEFASAAGTAAMKAADVAFHALHAPAGHLVMDDPFGVPAIDLGDLDTTAEAEQINNLLAQMDKASLEQTMAHFAAAHGDIDLENTQDYAQGRSPAATPMSPMGYYLRTGGSYVTAGVVFNTIQALFTRVFAKEMAKNMLDVSRKDGFAAVADLAARWKADPLGTLSKTYRGMTLELALTTPSYSLFQVMKGALAGMPEITSTMLAACVKAVSQTWPSRAKKLMMATDDPVAALKELVIKTKANPRAEMFRGAPATAAREVMTFGTAEVLGPVARTLMMGLIPGAESGAMAIAASCAASSATAAATTVVTHPVNHALTLQGKAGSSFFAAFQMAMHNGMSRGFIFALPTVFALLAAKQVAGVVTKSDALQVDASKVDWEHGAGADVVKAVGTGATAVASAASQVYDATAWAAAAMAPAEDSAARATLMAAV